MPTVAYTYSDALKESLKQVDILRRQILLYPLSPASELKLKYETNIDRISSWLTLLGETQSHQEIIDSINSHRPSMAYRFQKCIDHIRQEWLVNPQPITLDTLETFCKLLHSPLKNKTQSERIVKYLQSENSHPLVQAAIIHIHFYPDPICYPLTQLLLYKHGFDVRGLVVPEIEWAKNPDAHHQITKQMASSESLTTWLEYFTRRTIHQLRDIKNQLSLPHLPESLSSYRITSRQKQILSFLEIPNTSITNKQVQSMFKVSQITASRDLSQLTTLGLIFARGKGRSIYYTRI